MAAGRLRDGPSGKTHAVPVAPRPQVQATARVGQREHILAVRGVAVLGDRSHRPGGPALRRVLRRPERPLARHRRPRAGGRRPDAGKRDGARADGVERLLFLCSHFHRAEVPDLF